MTVFCIAFIRESGSPAINGGQFTVTADFSAFNDAISPTAQPEAGGGVTALIPFGTSAKKANDIIRKAVSDQLLITSANTIPPPPQAWTLDPDDIYFPMT